MRRVYPNEPTMPAWGYGIAILIIIAAGIGYIFFLKSYVPKPEIGEVKKKLEGLEPKTEMQYRFTAKDGSEVEAFVYDGKNKYAPNSKIIIFTPLVDKRDNSYIGAFTVAAKEVFGKANLKLSRTTAEQQYNSIINSNVHFWRINHLKEKFFCFPIKDSETSKIAALVVWIESVSPEASNTVAAQKEQEKSFQTSIQPNREADSTRKPQVEDSPNWQEVQKTVREAKELTAEEKKAREEQAKQKYQEIEHTGESHFGTSITEGGESTGSTSGSSAGKDVYVHGYTRKDGTYVHSYTRSAPGRGRY